MNLNPEQTQALNTEIDNALLSLHVMREHTNYNNIMAQEAVLLNGYVDKINKIILQVVAQEQPADPIQAAITEEYNT
jgi:hypothetical protein